MTDLFADIALATESASSKRKARPAKWYQRHAAGWQPEADDMTLAPRALAACNANQCPSLRYAPELVADEAMAGARLYYPLLGVLWEYRGTFTAPTGTYYEVEAIDAIPGCGIRRGSVWAAEAVKFRRLA